ncbi:MAG: TolC family protein, partial [Phaeodactylibacter sp.]|nr:TolC family protein [Phaeodactylibacter sp.]
MKRLIPLINLCFALMTLPVFAQQTLSLDEAVNYALEHSPEVKNAQLSVADANEQIVERRAIGIPQLSAGANYQYFIDIPTQVLPDFLSPSIYGILFQEGLVEPRDLMEGPGVPAQFGTKHNLTAKADLSTLIFDGSYFVGLQAAKAYR